MNCNAVQPVRLASLISIFALMWLGVFGASAQAQAPSRATAHPNVVLIIMDDLGYGDLGSYGAPDVKTPNIDGLARDGVRFTESYANGAVCTPTRAALISGRYQQRVGLENALSGSPADRDQGLPATGASLPALLKKAGYATGLVGKWHLGFKPEMGPNAHGFDEFFGFLSGAVDYYTHGGPDGKSNLYENTTPVETPRYLTDEITHRAVTFIERHAEGAFFLEVAYNATHWPFEPPDLSPADVERRRPRARLFQSAADSMTGTREDYVKMLERADQGVGEILRTVAAHGLARNTLVIFTNDNGGEWLSRNAPFFHRKGTLWEGGIRVPLIMRWPGRLPAGKTTTQVAITMDLTATILAAAGTSPPADRPLDGIDLLPIARGIAPVVARELFWRVPGRNQRAVRAGPWKLLVDGATGSGGAMIFLFDLRTDPGERHDLAMRYHERVVTLRARLAVWEKEVGETSR